MPRRKADTQDTNTAVISEDLLNIDMNNTINDALPPTDNIGQNAVAHPITTAAETEVLEKEPQMRKFEKNESPDVRSVITVGSVSPRNFDGTGDVDDWIEHYRYIAKCNNWKERMQKNRLPVHLRDTAELWYIQFMGKFDDKSTDHLSIAEIFEELRSAFRPKNFRSINQSALICRHQGLTEDVGTYYYDIMRLCHKMNPKMEEQEKLTHIMRGLRSGMLEKVLVLEPKDCTDLLGKLRSIEEAEILSNQRPNYNYLMMNNKATAPPAVATVTIPNNAFQEPNNTSDVLSKIESMFERLLNEMPKGNNYRPEYRNNRSYNRGYQYQRTVDGRPICNICHTPGHLARTCPRNVNNAGAITGSTSNGSNSEVVPLSGNQ